MLCVFFFTATATTAIYTLSLHDALPICGARRHGGRRGRGRRRPRASRAVVVATLAPVERATARDARRGRGARAAAGDRKSTRLNSSHVEISYAVFCLKKKKYTTTATKRS